MFLETLKGYSRISREGVLKMDPDAILLVTMGNVSQKEKEYWQKFKGLKAVKNNRIYIIDADKACRPTPVSFLAALKEVAGLLHPEAFDK